MAYNLNDKGTVFVTDVVIVHGEDSYLCFSTLRTVLSIYNYNGKKQTYTVVRGSEHLRSLRD